MTMPGKYRNKADEMVHAWSLASVTDECGSVEHGRWAGRLTFGPGDRAMLAARNVDDAAWLVGAIVTEDDMGFVDVDYFTSTRELDAAWMEELMADEKFWGSEESTF